MAHFQRSRSQTRYAFRQGSMLIVLLLLAAYGLSMKHVSVVRAAPTLSTPTLTLVQDGCATSALGSTNYPDPGDTLQISTRFTNDTGSSAYFRVVFRVQGNRGGLTTNLPVDLLYGGPTYMRTGLAVTGWDDSYGEVVNTPLIANGMPYTVSVNFSLLRQQFSNTLNLGNNATTSLTFRAELFSSDFSTYYGTATTTQTVKNTPKSGCSLVPNDASPALLTASKTTYLTSDTITLEWTTIGADDVAKLPAWGDTGTGTVDIVRLDTIPSGDPETDYTRNSANIVNTIATWTPHNTPTCTKPCSTTDERLVSTEPLMGVMNYSYQVGSAVQAFTNRTSFSASGLTANKTYLVRLRGMGGSSSHPLRQPQWTYFSVGTPIATGLSLGNLVWHDANNNGTVDASESGINGVTVQLYQDTNNSGGFDAGDTLLATQTTATANGIAGSYLFSGLAPGNYFVVLPLSNFRSGGVLVGYGSSTGTSGSATGPYEPAPDPDNDANNDDNGYIGSSGQGIPTRVITLSANTESTTDGDIDANSNLTLDIGVLQTSPTAIDLLSFTTAQVADTIQLHWATGTEYNTQGFNLYRSTTGQRNDAVRVTDSMIAAMGDGPTGWEYTWTDPTVENQVLYTYWLQEIETDGDVNEYGPVTARLSLRDGLPFRIFMPLMR